ncbi:MAG: helix-turn-helix domain-containing protein [Oscillospiraceae bacterium]|jgi:hypothetical protein|nr:helix-turn-helix domain-containing protein [Oscillospiraceae bacterium]
MKISLALLLDELGLETERPLPGGENPRFTSAELYAPGTEPPPDTLLVCPLSEAVAAEPRAGAHFLCFKDEAKLAVQPTGNAITVARGDFTLRELFNRVQRVFVRLGSWVLAMERSTAARGGLQELLELSEPILRNFITVQDGTFKLVAYTKNIPTSDDVMGRLVEQGYHPPETMELLWRLRRIEQFKTNTEIVVSRDKLTSEYDVVKKTYHVGGSIFLMTVMVCCDRPANAATIELFGLLAEYIKTYSDLEVAQTGGISGVKSLALDLLTQSIRSREEARNRAAYCGYPFEGGFRLYVFSFEDEVNVPVTQLVQSLAERHRRAVAFPWDGNVLLIEFEQMDTAEFCGKVAKELHRIAFLCGISDPFACLWDLPVAYEQAVCAADVSARLKKSARHGVRERFSLFSETWVHHLVSAAGRAAPGLFENSFPARAVETLRAYDKRHHTETMRLLRLFLENERSATEVSALVHMHRNTVLYHMEKVSDLLGISLADPETRLQLTLAFKADDFKRLQ